MITDIKVTYGAGDIISKELAKLHLRIDEDYTDEDQLVEIAISSAQKEAENYIERKLLKGTVELKMDSFKNFDIALQSINDSIEKIEYFDVSDVKQELSSDKFSFETGYSRLICKFKEGLPALAQKDDAVIVKMSFGFDAESCPKDIVSALLLLIADAFDKRENRSSLHESAARNLLNPYRRWL